MSDQKTKSQSEETVENIMFCMEYQQAIELIGRRWMGVILFALMTGPRRFNEIQNGIPGLSHRLLATRLRELEEQGVAVRKVITTSPIKVQYELTDAGLDLKDTVAAIMHWAEKWPVEVRFRALTGIERE